MLLRSKKKLTRVGIKLLSIFELSTLVLSALALSSCAFGSEEVPKLLEPVSSTLVTAKIGRQDIYKLTTYDTYAVPKTVELSFSEEGELDSVMAVIGQRVSEGERLAKLQDDSEAYEDLMDELYMLRAENNHSNLQMEIEIESGKTNSKDKSRSIMIYEQQKKLQAIEESYLLGKIAFEKDKISGNEIVAPFEGTVVSIKENLHYGDFMTSNSPVIVVASDEVAYVFCDYFSPNTLKTYSKVYAIIGGNTYNLEYIPYEDGQLERFRNDGDDFYAMFEVVGAGNEIIGEKGTIYLEEKGVTNVIAVPNEAVVRDGSSGYVYICDGDEKVLTPIKMGVTGVMYTEVIEGLKEGDVVYVSE